MVRAHLLMEMWHLLMPITINKIHESLKLTRLQLKWWLPLPLFSLVIYMKLCSLIWHGQRTEGMLLFVLYCLLFVIKNALEEISMVYAFHVWIVIVKCL